MNILTVAFLLLPAFLSAQQTTGDGFIQIDRFLGLNDTNLASTLSPYQSQSCLNVEANLFGTSIKKRAGYQLLNTLTVSTASVTGSHLYFDGSGNQVVVVCNDRSCFKSLNNGNFINFLSTAATGITYWQFVDINGNLYGVNSARDPPFQYDGTNFTSPPTMPLGNVIELTKDRLVIAGTTANPNRVFYSQSGVYTNFTTGPQNSDPWTDDIGSPGDRITAVKYFLGQIYVFKRFSITSCILTDQYSTKCYPVSNVIGTIDPLAIVQAPDAIYFRSADRAYYRLDSYGLQLISRNISNFVKSQTSGQVLSNYVSLQSQWQAGNQTPTNSWNTMIIPGSVFDSTTVFIDNNSIAFASGTLINVSTTPVNSVYITRPGNVTFINAGAEIDSATNWGFTVNSNQGWVQKSNAQIASDCPSSPNTSAKFGSFAWKDTGSPINIPYNLPIAILSTNNVILVSTAVGINNNMPWTNVNITLPTGYSQIKIRLTGVETAPANVMTSSAIVNGYNLPLWFMGCDNGAGTVFPMMDMDETISQPQSGTFTSRCFDSTFSTPTWGSFNVTYSSSAQSGLTFQTQVATSCTGTFDAPVAITPGNKVTSAQKEVIQYVGNFTLNSSTNAPAGFSNFALVTATTGTFVTPCLNTNGSNAPYGTLSCSNSNVGAGSEIFYATSAATCANLPTSTMTAASNWTVQTNNSAMTISTGSFIAIRFDSLLGSATDVAQINSCFMDFTQGTTAQPSWGIFDPVRNAIFWTTTINNSTSTNRTLKFDLNLNEWFPFDTQFTALKMINAQLFAGSATGGFWYQYGPDGTINADNGAAINAFWQSKDFAGLTPFSETTWRKIYLNTKNFNGGSFTETWLTSNGQTGSNTVSTGGTAGNTYVRSTYNIPLVSPSLFFNIKLGNNSANMPFEVGGMRLDYTTLPPYPGNP